MNTGSASRESAQTGWNPSSAFGFTQIAPTQVNQQPPTPEYAPGFNPFESMVCSKPSTGNTVTPVSVTQPIPQRPTNNGPAPQYDHTIKVQSPNDTVAEYLEAFDNPTSSAKTQLLKEKQDKILPVNNKFPGSPDDYQSNSKTKSYQVKELWITESKTSELSPEEAHEFLEMLRKARTS